MFYRITPNIGSMVKGDTYCNSKTDTNTNRMTGFFNFKGSTLKKKNG